MPSGTWGSTLNIWYLCVVYADHWHGFVCQKLSNEVRNDQNFLRRSQGLQQEMKPGFPKQHSIISRMSQKAGEIAVILWYQKNSVSLVLSVRVKMLGSLHKHERGQKWLIRNVSIFFTDTDWELRICPYMSVYVFFVNNQLDAQFFFMYVYINKHTWKRIVHQVGYLQRLYRDAWSTEYKILYVCMYVWHLLTCWSTWFIQQFFISVALFIRSKFYSGRN
jgi:hypothetical protein